MDRWALVLFLASFTVRLAFITEPLWYDEAFTAYLARLPLPRLIAATASDVHPPLWYVIEWITVRAIGSSEAALRFPALIAGSLLVTEVYHLAREIAGRSVAIGAGVIALFTPGLIYYSVDARMYPLLSSCVFFAVRSAIRGKGARVCVASAAILWLHNLGAVYVALIAVVALWRMKGRAILPLALAAAAWLPWLPSFLAQLSQVESGFWIPPANPGVFFVPFIYNTLYLRTPPAFSLHAVTGVAAGIIACTFAIRRQARAFAPILALAYGPPAMLLLLSLTVTPAMLPRAMLPSAAALPILWSAGLAALPRIERLALAAILLPSLGAGLYGLAFNTDARRLPLPQYVQPVIDGWEPGDVIYTVSAPAVIGLSYYLPGKPIYAVSDPGGLVHSVNDATRQILGIESIQFEGLAALGYRRAWVFDERGVILSRNQLQAIDAIREDWPVLATWQPLDTKEAQLTIYLVEVRP